MKSISEMKNQEVTTLYVNPVPRISAQGRHKQVFTIHSKTGEIIPTVGMNKTKEFGVGSHYQFQQNFMTGKLVTGLDKPVENPFKGLEPSLIIEQNGLSQDWLSHLETIVKQDQIKLQTKYEISDRVSYDYYTDALLSGSIFKSPNNVKALKEPSFLERFEIVLYDRPNRFSDDTPRGRLAIALIKIHPKIANTRQSMNSSVHDWYISEENEAQMEKVKKQEIVEEATAYWYTLKSNTTPFRIYQIGSLLTNQDGHTFIKGKMRDASIREYISDYLTDSSHQMDNIEKFKKLYNMTLTKEGLHRLHVMYLIQQAINTNVIKISDGFYVWHSKSGTPNMYKHSNYDKLVSLIQQEYSTYNPADPSITNWYKDLLEETASKGAWIE